MEAQQRATAGVRSVMQDVSCLFEEEYMGAVRSNAVKAQATVSEGESCTPNTPLADS